ncbi:hypothetical protein VNO78_22070 [Psophocarpus tetragonolobus]|uniref:Uncharacterized protein n=1 Tax=Psophocarpus tetragonolobus TaxID=3891 RepID=A0AAN9SCP8_PSOTE
MYFTIMQIVPRFLLSLITKLGGVRAPKIENGGNHIPATNPRFSCLGETRLLTTSVTGKGNLCGLRDKIDDTGFVEEANLRNVMVIKSV